MPPLCLQHATSFLKSGYPGCSSPPRRLRPSQTSIMKHTRLTLPLHSSWEQPLLSLLPPHSSHHSPPWRVFGHTHGLAGEFLADAAAQLAGPAMAEGQGHSQGPTPHRANSIFRPWSQTGCQERRGKQLWRVRQYWNWLGSGSRHLYLEESCSKSKCSAGKQQLGHRPVRCKQASLHLCSSGHTQD